MQKDKYIVPALIAALLAVLLFSSSCETHTPSAAPKQSASVTRPDPLPGGNDWTQYRFDIHGTGVNAEGHISLKNVSQLTLRWASPTFKAFESTPAIVDGKIYVTNGNSLYAFDLRTGHQLWRFDGFPQNIATVSSSVAIDPQMHLAYYGTPDARVYAVDTLTGTQVWMRQLGDPKAGADIWSSPLLVHGKLYIGLASYQDDPCVRGAIFALNQATGEIAWTHYTVPEGQVGGSVWSSLTAIPDAHEVVATTANACPEGVPGYNDFEEDSFIGLDWDTGKTLWQYNVAPYSPHREEFGEGAVDYVYNGKEYLVAGNKDGIVYAVNPPTANNGVRLAWSLQITHAGFLGKGGIFQPATYSNGLVFVAGGPTLDGKCHSGALYALQADTGAIRWRVCTSGHVVSPASSTGDVLFVAQQQRIIAYEQTSGNVLWQSTYTGTVWGGVSISRGFVVFGTVAGKLYCYGSPKT